MHLHMQMRRMEYKPWLHSHPHMITTFKTFHQSGVERPCPTPPHQVLSFPDAPEPWVAHGVPQKPEHWQVPGSLLSCVIWHKSQHLSEPQLLVLILILLTFPTCPLQPPSSFRSRGSSGKLMVITVAHTHLPPPLNSELVS